MPGFLRRVMHVLAIGVFCSRLAHTQHIPGYNCDESKVPPYVLLDPLKLDDGTPVTLGSLGGRKPKGATELLHHTPDDSRRVAQTQEWEVEKMLSRGYGLAMTYCGDIQPDFKDASQSSVSRLFMQSGQHPSGDASNAIGAWAWSPLCAVDYLVSDKDIDSEGILVTGHSRFGKVADWAVAHDLRIVGVLSIESGKGGQFIEHPLSQGDATHHIRIGKHDVTAYD